MKTNSIIYAAAYAALLINSGVDPELVSIELTGDPDQPKYGVYEHR